MYSCKVRKKLADRCADGNMCYSMFNEQAHSDMVPGTTASCSSRGYEAGASKQT